MTIPRDVELFARGLGALLALVCLAYWRELRKGGALLAVRTWLGEAGYHVRRFATSLQAPSENWTETRTRAVFRASRRYWRGRYARRARLRKYRRTWFAKPEFQAAKKKSTRLAITRAAR